MSSGGAETWSSDAIKEVDSILKVVKEATRARGSLALDPKEESTGHPERFCAWDEDRTTLAIEATRHLPSPALAFVGPGIDLETLRIALDLPVAHHASDPMSVAKSVVGPALAIGCPDDHTAVAALVDATASEDRDASQRTSEGARTAPPAPRDVSGAPRMVSALRAHQESRAVAPAEPMPDSPMGAYVPWGTWMEDLPARLRLVAQRCVACGRVQYPPRGACLSCRARTFAQADLPKQATVYSFTRIGRGGAPSEFALEQAQIGAYWVAVVEWKEEGVRVTARLADFDETGPAIGDPVTPVVRRLFTQEGRVRYGLKFRA